MSNSVRIRTKVGVDTSLKVLIDQEFDYLEILSLKILQSDIYTRQCADYGVVVGRVSVNNGFGIPNAKVSVFIPLDSIDKDDPVISNIYPYSNLYDVNDDGYRYNLLPYKPSYSAHIPTGTFFTRKDVLLSPVLGEIYDKYYKYNAVTNSSGDYMIFGVPVGSHTIVVDIDLSDIGEFSLSPQDLIRMGRATETQVDGTKFRASTNLGELPQIVGFKRTIEIEPLWGQPEICNLGITRTDFDLTGEANIDIRPTAIFMGSIISDTDSNAIRANGRPTSGSGFLCNLTTGPGEILAIRQTIQHDSVGRPILEAYGLEGGGTIIDEKGTWMIDVPMNLDYFITNEFGEQVLSPDPHKGIPTKGKYRFKVKWAQSPSESSSTKRANYLIPNIKDWGGGGDSTLQQKSYAFSLDWDDYGDDANYPEMIQDAIDCKDRFYMMQYNKVYTVSQYIDEWRKGSLFKFVAIKNILDETCESENNRYPTNDGYFRFDFFYVLFSFLSIILTPIFYALILIMHIVYFIVWVLRVVFFPFMIIYFGILAVEAFIGAFSVGFGVTFSFGIFAMGLTYLLVMAVCIYILVQLWKINLGGISVPILTYPDCSMCSCEQGRPVNENPDEDNGLKDLETGNEDLVPCSDIFPDPLSSSPLSLGLPILQLSSASPWKVPKTGNTTFNSINYGPYDLHTSIRRLAIQNEFTGRPYDGQTANPGYGAPYPYTEQGTTSYPWMTTALPIADRINLFNVKAKYFDSGPNNPGGGVNKITVKYDPTRNPDASKFHYDNTIVILCPKATLKKYASGQMIAFQNPAYSSDVNLNSPIINKAGNYAITGDTFTGATTVTVPYANPNGTSGNVTPGPTYNVFLTGNTKYNYIYRYPTDVEYFQVITGMTYSAFTSLCSNSPIDGSLNKRYISNVTTLRAMVFETYVNSYHVVHYADNTPTVLKPVDSIKNRDLMGVIILNRGVDPYTDKIDIDYGLGKLFGFPNEDAIKVSTKCRMNIPIQGKFLNTSHLSTDYNLVTINNVAAGNSNDFDQYSGNKLYHDSFSFTPQPLDISGDTLTYDEQMNTGYTFTFLSAGYSGFNSNLISYYSALDNRSLNFKPACINGTTPNPPVSDGAQFGTNGLSIKTTNPFTKQIITSSKQRYTDGCSGCDAASPPIYYFLFGGSYKINGSNEGYIPNEVVEGGSMMNINGGWDSTYLSECALPDENGQKYSCGMYSKWYHPRYHNAANPDETLFSYYYSPTYPSTANTLNFSSSTISGKAKIMRGDRLPTSTVPQEFCCNSWVLQKNSNLQVYLIPEKGVVGISSTVGSTGVVGSDTIGDVKADLAHSTHINGLFTTFTCNGSVNLECYRTHEVYPQGVCNGQVQIDYNGRRGIFGKLKFNRGCYFFVTVMFLSLIQDWIMMAEWIARNMVMLGACRNVFSHTFSNNWVNGNLYAMPFKYDTVGFTSPTDNPPNTPIYNYSKDVVIRNIFSNNFYYKCSKYDPDSKEFSGEVKYPTTIMDLGPRSYFLQELVMSDEYDGYIVNKLNSSSFSHVDEILNLFIISRFLNKDFRETILGAWNIIGYFLSDERTKYLKFDGDYSQLISISSELGVAAFQATNYPDYSDPDHLQNPIFIGCDGKIGIFFSSDTQIRDYVSPKRTIVDSHALLSNQTCAFSNFPIYSQEVPLSQWKIATGAPSIFGGENNTWWDNGKIYSSKYQSLDRLDVNSRYFRNTGIHVLDDKGYIYAVDGNGDLTASPSAWIKNPGNTEEAQMVTVGAPFYFYFGLKRGGSSFDRFRSKWVNTENLVS